MIFHLSFPFIFSQSPIISLQSPIERWDIASPFSHKKGWNHSAGALLPYMLKLRNGISLYGEKGKRRRSICWSCLVSVSWPDSLDPTSNDVACSSSQMVDARGNTVTHGFILVPIVGPYVQQRDVREHCTVLHWGVPVVGGTSEAREGGKLPGLC